MAGVIRPRVLCVDDEVAVLEGLRDTLHKSFDVVLCSDPVEALTLLEPPNEPFEVVVSDMRMPVMNGATFLGSVRVAAPATVRLLLTGQADVESAIAAVNKGEIFRFLTKPCPREQLLPAIAAAVRQHRLVTSEQVLLQQTLPLCAKVLNDVLAIACPEGGARAKRVQGYATALATAAKMESLWEVETAALLSQLEAVSLHTSTLERLDSGEELTADEEREVGLVPSRSARHLAPIPRFEDVAEMLVRQAESRAMLADDPEAAPLVTVGAKVLKIVLDYDLLATRGNPPALALAIMRGRDRRYDRVLLDKLAGVLGTVGRGVVEYRPLGELEVGMTIASKIVLEQGALLLPRGQTVTEDLLARLRGLGAHSRGQTVAVLV